MCISIAMAGTSTTSECHVALNKAPPKQAQRKTGWDFQLTLTNTDHFSAQRKREENTWMCYASLIASSG